MCDLAVTGAALPVVAISVVALVLVTLGAVLLVGRGRRARTGKALALALVFIAVVGITGGTVPAEAAFSPSASEACAPDQQGGGAGGDGSLTIVQTSVNTGIKPGAATTTLVGTITNQGKTSTYITEVTVSIESVTKAFGAAEGQCSAADYVLLYPSMPVARTIDPGESAQFSGAEIGFSDTALNQDACKSATLHLRYLSS